jgi:hypothetical protein
LLQNEITKELNRNPKVKFADLDKLSIDKVNATVFNNTKNYLQDLNNYYLQKYKNANSKRDKLASELNKDDESKELFIQMKDRYTNDALSDFVKDKNEMNKIIELDNQLYQKADPVYLSPDGFRAHFYAPEKKVFGTYIDTYWVNIGVIWLMSIILAFTLYFDVLKNFILGIEKLLEKIKK